MGSTGMNTDRAISRHAWKPASNRRCAIPLALVALLVAAVLAVPTIAGAAPALTTTKGPTTLLQGSTKMAWTVSSTEGGSSTLEVRNAAGKVVAVVPGPEVDPAVAVSVSWDGRATHGNDAGAPVGSYVPAGTYTAQLTVTSDYGSSNITGSFKVTTPPKPKITSVSVPRTVAPAPKVGGRAAKIVFQTTARHDVTIEVVSAKSGKVVSRKIYRDVAPKKKITTYWDGHVTIAGSAVHITGEKVLAGDIAPAGKYTVRIRSLGAVVSRPIVVSKTKASSVAVTGALALMPYEATQQLVARVMPRGTAPDAYTWTSSNAAILAVDGAGVVTSKRREGTVTITATLKSQPKLKGTMTIEVKSDSTLELHRYSLAKWYAHKSAPTPAGTITSNYPINWVRVVITDSVRGVEYDQTFTPGTQAFQDAATMALSGGSGATPYFSTLTPGVKRLRVTASDAVCARTLISRSFMIVGPTRYQTFWDERAMTWSFPIDTKQFAVSSFGAYRDNGTRAHAAIDMIKPAGTPVFAMSDGVVERVSIGTYYAGTGAVQVRHTDGSVIWYCEVRPYTGMKPGVRVAKDQRIATIQSNRYGTSMLHLEAYSGGSTGALYQSKNRSTYDNVTPAPFMRRRDLISPMGVTLLSIPATRTALIAGM